MAKVPSPKDFAKAMAEDPNMGANPGWQKAHGDTFVPKKFAVEFGKPKKSSK